MATHSSILAWETPWTEEPGGLQSIGSQRLGHGATERVTHPRTQTLGKVVLDLYVYYIGCACMFACVYSSSTVHSTGMKA